MLYSVPDSIGQKRQPIDKSTHHPVVSHTTHSMGILGPTEPGRQQHHHSRVYVALGSNLGDRVGNLRKAVAALNEVCMCMRNVGPSSRVVRPDPRILTQTTQEGVGVIETTSGFYESKAQYVVDQPDFLNAVCRLRTPLDPPALLRELKRVERQLGRVPSIRCALCLQYRSKDGRFWLT